jgi:hypothetical protein
MEKRLAKEKGAQVDDMLVCENLDRYARGSILCHQNDHRTSTPGQDEH